MLSCDKIITLNFLILPNGIVPCHLKITIFVQIPLKGPYTSAGVPTKDPVAPAAMPTN
jgi:hypothetical protein